MGVGAPARLDGGHLPGGRPLADVEDPDPAEPLRIHLRLLPARGRRPAVETATGLLDGHEEEIAEHAQVTLSARTYDRCHQLRIGGIRDIVGGEPVEAPDVCGFTLKRDVGVRVPDVSRVLGIEEAGRTVAVAEERDVERRLARIGPSRRKSGARVRNGPAGSGVLAVPRDREQQPSRREECGRRGGGMPPADATRPAGPTSELRSPHLPDHDPTSSLTRPPRRRASPLRCAPIPPARGGAPCPSGRPAPDPHGPGIPERARKGSLTRGGNAAASTTQRCVKGAPAES